MSQSKAKEARREVAAVSDDDLRRISKKSAAAVAELASNTNKTIINMKENWPLEDRIQFCKWFLDVETVEELADSMGMTLVEETCTDPEDCKCDPQMEMDFKGGDDGADTGGESQG